MDEKTVLEDGSLPVPIPGEYGHPMPRELMFRELGFNGPFSRHSVGKAIVSATLKTKAVHTMSTKSTLSKKNFKLPSGARTTFHLAFSPDGTKVASCHGDHNVYVSDITTLELHQTLTGHPRTPWCVVFHPTQNDILASGCLAGHVRIWDLNGGSELLVCDSGTVIASLSFHPTVRLLAIATFNEIIFWDWARPYPLARTSTGNVKEKVRLIRFDRLGHNLVTGITNFPNPPVGGPLDAGNAEGDGGEVPFSARSRSAFFRPNILSRTPQPTHAAQAPPRPSTPTTLGLEDEGSRALAAAHSVSAMTDVLTERQERFQESYRQLVHHYDGLVQHYQHFIRTRLGLGETPNTSQQTINYFQEDGNPTASSHTPPIDIVISENPSHHLPNRPLSADSVGMERSEVPGPSTRLSQSSTSALAVSTAENSEQASTSSTRRSDGEPRNNNDLRSIQTLEQNILQMQNLCMQARRDSSNFPVEPVHIQELRTIRRHLEVLQDQTRRLQTSIRHTLSSLAQGTGGLEALRGRLSSFTPPILPTPPFTPPSGSIPNSPISVLQGPVGAGPDEPSTVNTVEDIIGRTIQNALGGVRRGTPASGRVTPAPPPDSRLSAMELNNAIPSTSAAASQQRVAEGEDVGRRIVGPSRFAREFPPEAAHEHSRFCPYGEGSVGRSHTRMRCMTDMGQSPVLSVWPTVETGLERRTRSFHVEGEIEEGRDGGGVSGRTCATATSSGDRSQANSGENAFPSFGSWMGEGPGWINNDLGVRVYLTVRQFNERINSLRTERDQLLAERDDLLARRARATTQLARAQQAARAREGDIPENWQRNFNSGVALVPTNVREGSRNYARSMGARRALSAVRSAETAQDSSAGRSGGAVSREAGVAEEGRRLPLRLEGNLERMTSVRLADEMVPVYGHVSEREVHAQNVFVYPIGLFLAGSGWPSSSLAIYWPHASREEEDSMLESRRSEGLIPVFMEESGVLEEGSPRFRLTYDSSRLVLDLSHDLSLTFIQPGLPLLDTITTMGQFQRPRENSGRVYINHVTPFLDALQRVFGSRRRRDVGGASQSPTHAPTTLRLSTVLQPGPYSVGRGFHYSLRARRLDGPGNAGSSTSSTQSPRQLAGEDGGEGGERVSHQVNVRLRRELLRDWERSVSVYRSGNQQNLGSRPRSGNHTPPPALPPNFTQAEIDETGGSESASLASTRRVIRLAVATAASSVLRRPHLLSSYAPPNLNSFQNGSSRAVESRIERVLNERGNRGELETGAAAEALEAQDGSIYAAWTPPPLNSGGSGAELSVDPVPGRSSPVPDRSFSAGQGLSLRGVSGVDERGSYFLRLRPLHSAGEDVRGVVTSARPLRRSYSQMTGHEEGPESGDSEDSDEADAPMLRRMRFRRAEGAVDGEGPTLRRRGLRSPDSRHNHPFETDVIGGGVLRRLREGRRRGDRTGSLSQVGSGRRELESEGGLAGMLEVDRMEGIGRGSGGSHGGPSAFLVRRDARNPPLPPHQAESGRHVYYRRRLGGREYGGALSINPQEEMPVGARFYPAYIPEIVITPRARPPNYYTLDASTTAFLSSRIQKWDFSSFAVPKLELRDEGVVVRECSLHSDACLDLSSDGDFMAVCIPSDSGSYSAIGIYSMRDESLGDIIHMFHFDQNTVSVSIAPSSDYLVVGYAGRGGPLYRFVQHTRAIGQILSLARDGDGGAKLVSVKELFTDNQSTLMSVNCMHWVPVSGYGIIYGTNTGELVLLS